MTEATKTMTPDPGTTTVCGPSHCRYCHAATDYLGVSVGTLRACYTAKQADRMGELAAYDYLRGIRTCK